MIWRRQSSLLSALLLAASLTITGCASGPPPKPDIPASISPGWKLLSFDKTALPPEIPPAGSPDCWKGVYAGAGSADVWICGYRVSGNAFEAVQRVRAEAQAVKFQQDRYFVLVKWNNTPKASLTTLVRAIERALGARAS